MNIFIIIHTFHNIANLIPIMEKINKEKDKVIILYEKDQDIKDNKFPSLEKILYNKIIKKSKINKPILKIKINDLKDIKEFIKILKSEEYHYIYFIFNGGTKIQFLDVYLFLSKHIQQNKLIFLYNNIKPCAYYERDTLKTKKVHLKYYEKHRIGLKEVLMLQNFKINIENSKKIYSEDNKNQNFYNDKSLIKTINNFFEDLIDIIIQECNFGEKMNSNKLFKNNKSNSLGEYFEDLVANRLLNFITNNPKYLKIIQEIYKNVHISSKNGVDNYQAEFDIIIVLKNGILLYIECKSGLISQKDLDAKFANLQRVSSLFSQMIITVPVIDLNKPYENKKCLERYIKKVTEREKYIANKKYYFLPFTESLNYKNKIEFEFENRQYQYETFENTLSKILDEWLIDGTKD
ncbi:MAG: hypothetical protein KatS3mg129_0568 [Leptospiraceae bacterium]|nr:MAG: hypothetical protein KatS3mg129_0568 [Leptospiraceae bacterium]